MNAFVSFAPAVHDELALGVQSSSALLRIDCLYRVSHDGDQHVEQHELDEDHEDDEHHDALPASASASATPSHPSHPSSHPAIRPATQTMQPSINRSSQTCVVVLLFYGCVDLWLCSRKHYTMHMLCVCVHN
jgi:hypothetical protein